MSDAATTVPPWTLGWRLQRSLAWADGMTMEQMADELGIARSTVSRWCNDKGHPTRGYLTLWAQRTRVPFDWLAEGDYKVPPVDSVLKRGRLCDDHPSRDEILSLRKAIPMQFALTRARAT